MIQFGINIGMDNGLKGKIHYVPRYLVGFISFLLSLLKSYVTLKGSSINIMIFLCYRCSFMTSMEIDSSAPYIYSKRLSLLASIVSY